LREKYDQAVLKINKSKTEKSGEFSPFKRWTVVIMDRSHGIDRPLIGEGKFSLGIIGGKVYLEYLFESLREIEKLLKVPIRIVVPYAYGLDRNAPHYAPRDSFHFMTTPCRTGSYQKNRILLDQTARRQLEKTALRYQVKLLQVEKETSVYDWCKENLLPEEDVMWLNSGQIALNINATCMLIHYFVKN